MKDSANFTLKLDGAEDRSAGPLDVTVRLTAPPPGKLLSTDFPLIEGTPLIAMDLSGVPGTLSWDYLFPIRGVYRLDVAATDEDRRRWHRTFELRVRESGARAAFLVGFATALFLLGILAGRLFTGVAGRAGLLVIPLLAGVGVSGSLSSEPRGEIGRAGALKHTLTVTAPRAGALSTIRWRGVDDATGKPVPAAVTLKVVQLEKDREVFRLDRLPTDGSLELSFQFTDASPHQVMAIAVTPGQKHEAVTMATVHVDSATPPLRTRIQPVLLFLLAVTAGLAAGRISKRWRTRLRWNTRRVRMDPKEAS